jgi:hypothetical protein
MAVLHLLRDEMGDDLGVRPEPNFAPFFQLVAQFAKILDDRCARPPGDRWRDGRWSRWLKVAQRVWPMPMVPMRAAREPGLQIAQLARRRRASCPLSSVATPAES